MQIRYDSYAGNHLLYVVSRDGPHPTWLRLAAGHLSKLAESQGGLRPRETSLPIVTSDNRDDKYDKVLRGTRHHGRIQRQISGQAGS